jgi:hypothetical protein
MQEAEEAAQVSKLVEEFRKGAELYFEGREIFNRRKQSKGLDIVIRAAETLDSLGSGRRDALLPLLDSDDVEVVVMAANNLMKIVPERALAVLEKIDTHGTGVTSMYAMTVLAIRKSGYTIG